MKESKKQRHVAGKNIKKKNQTKHKTDTLLMQRLVAYWNEPKTCLSLRSFATSRSLHSVSEGQFTQQANRNKYNSKVRLVKCLL